MRQKIVLCVPVLIGCTFGLRADAPMPEAADDLKLLAGDWKPVALESNGKKASTAALEGGRWSFTGAEVRFADPGDELGGKSSVKLDASKSPKHIDLVALEGPEKGMTMQGIYKLDQDRLVICLRDPVGDKKGRPKTFSTEADSDLHMITLERVKDEK